MLIHYLASVSIRTQKKVVLTMRLRSLIFFLIVARSCLSEIIIEPLKPQQSELLQAVVTIMKGCYVNRVSTVGIAGNAGGPISETLWFRELIPVALIDKAQRIVNHGRIPVGSRHRLQLFVVTATSSSTLSETLKGIKESIWWNHMASVLIVDLSIPGCSNRFEVLWAAWEMDLLASNFLCLHETKGWLIYTYNPYTSKAPNPWNLENTYKGKNDHTWTLFVRRYQEAEDICDELDFDKSSDLGGYVIRTSVANTTTKLFVEINPEKNGTERLSGMYAEIGWTLYGALNATPKILEPLPYDEMDDNGNLIGVPAEINNGISDFAINVRYRLLKENYTLTYPFWHSGVCVMSQYTGSASQLSKIAGLIDNYSKLGLCLVCLITVIFFACFLRHSLSSAILNTLRLISNAALIKMPKNLAPRIYLATIFILVVNIQGMYQGKLASLLTKNVDLRNVETVQDLSKYSFTVYGPSRLVNYFNDSHPPINYLWGMDALETCLNLVRQDSRVACAYEKNLLLSHAVTYKLYLSTKPAIGVHWTYMMRKNWPPEKKLNQLLRRLVEADVIRIMYEKEVGKDLRALQAIKDMKTDQSFEILVLSELSFAFEILAIGLICGCICFIVEFGMRRTRTRKKIKNLKSVKRSFETNC